MKRLTIWIYAAAILSLFNGYSEEWEWFDSAGEECGEEVCFNRMPMTGGESLEPYQKLNPISQPYRLRVGDVMQISLYGEPGSLQEVAVDPRGMVNYLYLDPLPAIGKTVDQLRRELQGVLKEQFRFATLSVTPTFFGGNFFTVSGEVFRPGNYPLQGRPTVLSAIAQAQGLTTREFREQLIDGANLHHSFLIRNGEYVPVDFYRLVKMGDLRQDIPLQSGDYIYLAEEQVKQVYVLGEVRSTVSVNYFDRLTLAEAIAEAGGLSEFASSRVVVLRGALCCPIRYLIDIKRVLKGCASDFVLEQGDIVYVPPRKFTFWREIFREAVRSFVGTAASIGGTAAFIKVHPHAAGDLESPVNVIGFFGASSPQASSAGSLSTTQ